MRATNLSSVTCPKIIAAARGAATRSIKIGMIATYWLIVRQFVEFEQEGKKRAHYGEEVIKRLVADFSACYDSGFSLRNMWQIKAFYLQWSILQTPSAELTKSEGREVSQIVPMIGRFEQLFKCINNAMLGLKGMLTLGVAK